MATKKKPTKKASTAKAVTKKTKAKTAKAQKTVTRVVSKPASTAKKKKGIDTAMPTNLINILVAEIIGTFILAIVTIFAGYFMSPLYVGLTFAVMVIAIGAISGSHINPAVTFGLWTMRKLKTILVPFYWAAQFLGAMAAVVLIGSLSGDAFAIHFDHFTEFSWAIFAIELIGTAIFMFGFAAAIERVNLKKFGKAICIGMSLTIALLVGDALLPYVKNAAMADYQEAQASEEKKEDEQAMLTPDYPREVYIGGVTLNPAVALVASEQTDSQLQGSPVAQEGEKSYTRLSTEVIFATLVGAALGGNLFLLLNNRTKEE